VLPAVPCTPSKETKGGQVNATTPNGAYFAVGKKERQRESGGKHRFESKIVMIERTPTMKRRGFQTGSRCEKKNGDRQYTNHAAGKSSRGEKKHREKKKKPEREKSAGS